MPRIRSKLALAAVVSLALGLGALAQEPIAPGTSASTEELIELERIRTEVSLILEEFLDRASDGEAHVEKANSLADRAAIDARDYAPFFAEELERDRPATFDFCALALGKMRTPAAETALRRAIDRADEELGDWARVRKAIAVWALGLQGRITALELMDEGRHQVANYSIHQGTSVLAAVAYQVGPESVPMLFEFADEFLADEEREYWMLYVLGALRRVADPGAVPQLVKWTKHPNGLVRREALRALRTTNTDEGVDALFAALGNEDLGVRRVAAGSLEFVEPTGREAEIRRQLDSRDDSLVRGSLYQLLAATSGLKALPALTGYWDSDDVKDRRELIDAVITLDSAKAVDLLELALADSDLGVAMRAASGLGTIGNRRAIALLTASIEHADWILAQAALKQLARLHARSAGPAVTARLLHDLQEPVVSGDLRSNLERALNALVELRYSPAAELLIEASEGQPDRGLVQALRSAARRLQTLEEIGAAVPKWAELASGPDAEMRALARSRLGEIGSSPAVSALESSFDTVPDRERREILEAIAETGSDRAAGLLERVLTSPEFATSEALREREAAAWAASRVGGRKMFELLSRAVKLRNGRDGKVTAYMALAGGPQAIPLLTAYRATQMQYIGWERGRAQERLNWVLGQLERGRAIDVLDRPPARLTLIP